MPFSTYLNLGVNKSFLLYAYISFPINSAVYMPIILFERMRLSICLYYHLKRCTFLYAYVIVYICFHIYVHIVVCKGACLQIHRCGSQQCSVVCLYQGL
jgi:hypothetical protein